MGADGDTGPSPPSAATPSPFSEPLKRETAPYPIPPATAKIARFWRMAEDEDGFLLPLSADEDMRRLRYVDCEHNGDARSVRAVIEAAARRVMGAAMVVSEVF